MLEEDGDDEGKAVVMEDAKAKGVGISGVEVEDDESEVEEFEEVDVEEIEDVHESSVSAR